MLKDRKEAGVLLASKLRNHKGSDAVVIALPRGGVVLGYEIATKLKLPLDVVILKKVGHPDNPEYAICAIDATGMELCHESEREMVDATWLESEIRKKREEAKQREKLYFGVRPKRSLAGKTVIIVDDGAATGLTIRLAVKLVQSQKPKEIIVALPIAPQELVADLEHDVDQVVLLLPPEEFSGSVGAHYREFEQTTDEEVVKLLHECNAPVTP